MNRKFVLSLAAALIAGTWLCPARVSVFAQEKPHRKIPSR